MVVPYLDTTDEEVFSDEDDMPELVDNSDSEDEDDDWELQVGDDDDDDDERPAGPPEPEASIPDWVKGETIAALQRQAGRGPKATDWVATYFLATDEDCQRLNLNIDWMRKECQYFVYQTEVCPTTGRKHYQCFAQFKVRSYFAKVKRLFFELGVAEPLTVHCEPRKGTVKDATDYCRKTETRLDGYGPYAMGEVRGYTDRPGKRNDLKRMRELNAEEAWINMDQVLDSTDDSVHSVAARHFKYTQANVERNVRRRAMAWRDVKVTVLWGSTGTNKTRYAMSGGDPAAPLESSAAMPYKWEPNSANEWWDGYGGERTLVIDEFYGQLKPERMLAMLDGYMLRLPIKGAFSYALWNKVYITSNVSPEQWYGESVPKDVKAALMRRINRVVHMDKYKDEWEDLDTSDEEEDFEGAAQRCRDVFA